MSSKKEMVYSKNFENIWVNLSWNRSTGIWLFSLNGVQFRTIYIYIFVTYG